MKTTSNFNTIQVQVLLFQVHQPHENYYIMLTLFKYKYYSFKYKSSQCVNAVLVYIHVRWLVVIIN